MRLLLANSILDIVISKNLIIRAIIEIIDIGNVHLESGLRTILKVNKGNKANTKI